MNVEKLKEGELDFSRARLALARDFPAFSPWRRTRTGPAGRAQ